MFNKQLKRMIGVDISSTSVKLLELGLNQNRYWVESFAVIPLMPETIVDKKIKVPEQLTHALQQLIRKSNPISRKIAYALPAAQTWSKTIAIDSDMSSLEIDRLAQLELTQHWSSHQDCFMDYERVVVDDVPQLLVVAADQEMINERIDLLHQVGLKTVYVDVENLAIERAVRFACKEQQYDYQHIAVFDVGHTSSSVSVFYQNQVVFYQDLAIGGQQLTQQVQQRYGLSFEEAGRAKKDGGLPNDYQQEVLLPYIDSLLQELQRALNFYNSTHEKIAIEHLFLAGGNANLPLLSQLLTEKMSYSVSIINPFEFMGVAPQIDMKKFEQDIPALLIACGLALRGFEP